MTRCGRHVRMGQWINTESVTVDRFTHRRIPIGYYLSPLPERISKQSPTNQLDSNPVHHNLLLVLITTYPQASIVI